MKTIEELEAQLTAISEQIKELKNKPKFEVGRWYILKTNWSFLVNISRTKNGSIYGYGFNHYGSENIYKPANVNWCSIQDLNLSRLATTEEVKAALVKEAEKRGFKGGDKLNPAFCSDVIDKNGDGWKYTESNDMIQLNGTAVYFKGKWATIIKDDVIKVGGYEVNFHLTAGKITITPFEKYTDIDGNIFTKQFWQAAKLISEHSKAKIMVGCSKQFDVSLEVINKILDKL